MANLITWIEETADGEEIEGVVIGEFGWRDEPPVPQRQNVLLTWVEARSMLDYEFSDGFGGVGCNAIWIWTKTWVIGVSQYDGSTSPFRVLRNPGDGYPNIPGG